MHQRPQKRFESEAEILKAIDIARAEAARQQKLCVTFNANAKRHLALGNYYEADEAEQMAKAADMKSGQLIQLTCKRLGERLSEFRTASLPFAEDFVKDASIPR